MANFALERDLAVTRTWHQHKDFHKVTWRSPENKICNQVDHIYWYTEDAAGMLVM